MSLTFCTFDRVTLRHWLASSACMAIVEPTRTAEETECGRVNTKTATSHLLLGSPRSWTSPRSDRFPLQSRVMALLPGTRWRWCHNMVSLRWREFGTMHATRDCAPMVKTTRYLCEPTSVEAAARLYPRSPVAACCGARRRSAILGRARPALLVPHESMIRASSFQSESLDATLSELCTKKRHPSDVSLNPRPLKGCFLWVAWKIFDRGSQYGLRRNGCSEFGLRAILPRQRLEIWSALATYRETPLSEPH